MARLRDYRARLTGAGVDLRVAVVAGAAANTSIGVPGIKPGDVLVAVLEFQPPTAASGNAIVADRAGAATVLQDAIRLSVNTTGNQLLVVWWSI
jgi:hypothetical protein